ncbi:hypothetical protein [Mycolicibacterium arenosum]|uniref:Uncharacterized protein n=1 Tax=Mycolicibacterium arenosum TaxID=2952157 RepID=A0ABT1M4B8_9MYCO|nr:hypothetical protein [Mycolicibacterium sp. CAU 1645]MCP9274016.1 hypothetical protein [Mycolicibacterium sp. CAU 1645]
MNTDGLRIAAANSDVIAEELATANFEGVSGAHPSQAGVAAVLAATRLVRIRQSQRIGGQADDLSACSACYDTTDSDGAATLVVTV